MPSAPSKGPSSSQWRIVGVAVSAVSVVGAGILAVVFFDQWWRFLRECCGGGRRGKEGVEELVPDWEKGDWEWKDGDGRFPNFGTPPIGGQGQGQGQGSANGNMNGTGTGVGYGSGIGQGGQSRWSRQVGRGRAWWDGGTGAATGGGHSWQVGTIAPAPLANAYGINGKHYSTISTNLAGLGLNSLGVIPQSLTPGASPNYNNPKSPVPVLVRPKAKHAAPVRPVRQEGLPVSSTTRSTFYAPEDAYDGLA